MGQRLEQGWEGSEPLKGADKHSVGGIPLPLCSPLIWSQLDAEGPRLWAPAPGSGPSAAPAGQWGLSLGEGRAFSVLPAFSLLSPHLPGAGLGAEATGHEDVLSPSGPWVELNQHHAEAGTVKVALSYCLCRGGPSGQCLANPHGNTMRGNRSVSHRGH